MLSGPRLFRTTLNNLILADACSNATSSMHISKNFRIPPFAINSMPSNVSKSTYADCTEASDRNRQNRSDRFNAEMIASELISPASKVCQSSSNVPGRRRLETASRKPLSFEEWDRKTFKSQCPHAYPAIEANTRLSEIPRMTICGRRCPSSKHLGQVLVFSNGGSGSSKFAVKPPDVDVSSGGFGW